MIHFNAFYGIDAHQETLSIHRITAEGDSTYCGTIPNTSQHIESFFTKEQSTYEHIQSVYEAGGLGYSLHRELIKLGVHNLICSPNVLPRTKIKNDRIDALKLAQFLARGEIEPIYVHSPEDEVVREKVRQRSCVRLAQNRARQVLLAFLRRYGVHYTEGKKCWTKKHLVWLGRIHFEDENLQEVYFEYLAEVERLQRKLQELDRKLAETRDNWVKKEVVKDLMTLRNIDTLSAMILVSEIGNFSRFKNARQLMGFLGLTPSEYSSGKRVSRGEITKTGNSHVRRILVEAAKGYRLRPNVTNLIRNRWEGRHSEVVEHAIKAQRRLHHTYSKLVRRGKNYNVATIAVARELAGFIWAIARMSESRFLTEERSLSKSA